MNTIKKFLFIVAAFFSVSAWATVEITGFEVSEADGTGTWDVTVTPGADAATGVGIDYQLDYTTVDDTAEDENGDNDYKKNAGTLDFTNNFTQQIVVTIVQDQKVEGTETLKVELTEVPPDVPASADQPTGPALPPVATGTGTILDDDIELLVQVQFEGGGGGPVDLELDCQGNGTIDDSTKTTVNGEATFLVADFVEPLDCTAAPVSSPPGSTIVSTDCDPGMDEDNTECLIVFGPTRATFRVTKIFADGNNVDEVEVSIDCNTGLILDQDKDLEDGEWVEFVVTSFNEGTMTCTITEDGLAGYAGEYDNVSLGNIISDENCEYTAVGGLDEHECEITNTPLDVDVDITKEWLYPGSADASAVSDEFTFVLYCTNASIVGGSKIGGFGLVESPSLIIDTCAFGGDSPVSSYDQYCKTLYGSGDETFNEQVNPYVWPGGSCYVMEIDVDSAVEVDNGCGSLEVSAGSGDSCTITNTVFFEGIPTLSQYGMALLALLMLGVGLVSFRRIV
jgi:hypothetical protein